MRPPQFKTGNPLTVAGDDRTVFFQHDVENHAVVGRVGLVAVIVPLATTDVNFDVARPLHPGDAQAGVAEVGAGISVVGTEVLDTDGISRGSAQVGQVETGQPPEVVKEVLPHELLSW